MKYFKITDDSGCTHPCMTIRDEITPDLIVLLIPHARRAEEITGEEYERSENDATD